MKDKNNYGTAVLNGRRNNSTDRLSNVSPNKTQVGKVTVSFGTITRPSQFTAKVTDNFKYNGTLKSSAYLAI